MTDRVPRAPKVHRYVFAFAICMYRSIGWGASLRRRRLNVADEEPPCTIDHGRSGTFKTRPSIALIEFDGMDDRLISVGTALLWVERSTLPVGTKGGTAASKGQWEANASQVFQPTTSFFRLTHIQNKHKHKHKRDYLAFKPQVRQSKG